MPLDALTLRGLARELDAELSGVRVDKIFQPGKLELAFAVRPRSGAARLMFSFGPSPAVYLTAEKRENPDKAPMFCMLLRKHLTGGRILSIAQAGLERILTLRLECSDELGMKKERSLVCELFGRYSNLILLDHQGLIIDCLRRVDYEMCEARPILPGLFYRLPDPPVKVAADTVDAEQFASEFEKALPGQAADRWLMDRFYGLSPLIAREISHLALGDCAAPISPHVTAGRDALWGAFQKVCGAAEAAKTPCLLLGPSGEYRDFSFLPIAQYGPALSRPMDDYSAMLSLFFETRSKQEKLDKKKRELARIASAAAERLNRKLGEQQKELAAAKDRETLRKWADLLMANLHLVGKGASSVTVLDFFSEDGSSVDIPLDPRLSGHKNAGKYYHDYGRLKNAEARLTDLLAEGERTLSYLDSVLDEIDRAESLGELHDIQEEMAEGGYSKAQVRKKGKPSAPTYSFLHFKTRSGLPVLAGRNNRENEFLSLKHAGKRDIWFHVKNAPGSHVVLQPGGTEPSPADLTDAAMIAAYHSKVRSSALVPVDYTEVRRVKKLKGAGPGMVQYDSFQTAYVTPDAGEIDKLRLQG